MLLALACVLAGTGACTEGNGTGPSEPAATTGEPTGQLGFANEEVKAWLAGLLAEEIESVDCECVTCEDATECAGALMGLSLEWAEYWQGDRMQLVGEAALDAAFSQIGEVFIACIEEAFSNSDCDIEYLECLLEAAYDYDESTWESELRRGGYSSFTDLLMDRGPISLPWYSPLSLEQEDRLKELTERILKKLEDCGYVPGVSDDAHVKEADEPEEEVDAATKELDELMEELGKRIRERTKSESEGVQKAAEAGFKHLDELLKGLGNETEDAIPTEGEEEVVEVTPSGDASEAEDLLK